MTGAGKEQRDGTHAPGVNRAAGRVECACAGPAPPPALI